MPWDAIHRRWATRELARIGALIPEVAALGVAALRQRAIEPDFGTDADRQALAELRASAAAAIRLDPARWPKAPVGLRVKRRFHRWLEGTAVEEWLRRRRGLPAPTPVARPTAPRRSPLIAHAIHGLTLGGAQQLVADLVSDPAAEWRHAVIAAQVPFPRRYPGLDATVVEHPSVPEVLDWLRRCGAAAVHLAHYHHPTDDRVMAWYDAVGRAARQAGLPVLQSNLTPGDPWLDPTDLAGRRGPAIELVCCSRWSLDACAVTGMRQTVIHPGSPLAEMREQARRTAESTTGQLRIGFAARLDGDKFDASIANDLIEALRRVPESTLSIAGDGGLRTRLESQFASAGLSDRTAFLGSIPFAALPPFYASLDLALAPMSADTFGSGSVHALASGTTVAGYANAALPEILVHPAALADPARPHALAATIERLLRDEPLRRDVLETQQGNAAANFDLPLMRSRYASKLRSLVGDSRPVGSLAVVTTIRNDLSCVPALVEAVPVPLRDRVQHVIADSGSNDGTTAALLDAATRLAHLRVVTSAAEPIAAGLNRAIAAADASHVVVLNADDAFEPGGLEKLFAAVAVGEPPDLVVGGLRVFDEHGRLFRVQRVRRMGVADILIDRDYPWNPACLAYARALHPRFGWYDSDEPLFDIAFHLAIAPAIRPVLLEEVIGRFNMRRESLTVKRIAAGELEGMILDLFRRFERTLGAGTRLQLARRRLTRRLSRMLRG